MAERGELIGSVIAGRWASDVDGEGRFPREAVDGLCHQGVLGSAVPVHLGGGGASMSEICELVRILGRHCASTAMVLAIHQAMVFAISRHGSGGRFDRVLCEIADDQLLVTGCFRQPARLGEGSSSTTAGATVLFGEEADVVLTRVGVADGAGGGHEDGLALVRTDEIALRQESYGDGLGLRGLGWNTYSLEVPDHAGDRFCDRFGRVAAMTLEPALRLLSGAAGVGIADTALDTAGRFVVDHGSLGFVDDWSEHALELAQSEGARDAAWDCILGHARNFGDCAVAGIDSGSTVASAMGICGPAGYRETGEFGLGRQLRDSLGIREMVVAAIGIERGGRISDRF
ncbi:acyl-CoA dehydrogenase family protein [Rhodococcus sp. ABRD24]|uniref:acyl-CoA dehydrogenase family protein n=1 Tax=Rhodococcus sp. ABRD24 TaxID=2507582 RepID=UPI0013F158F1|nr:acyl-CoA dehydrogenase family protein [Rhodococcus sp. ABRD24]